MAGVFVDVVCSVMVIVGNTISLHSMMLLAQLRLSDYRECVVQSGKCTANPLFGLAPHRIPNK